jgi:hypothetical protein
MNEHKTRHNRVEHLQNPLQLAVAVAVNMVFRNWRRANSVVKQGCTLWPPQFKSSTQTWVLGCLMPSHRRVKVKCQTPYPRHACHLCRVSGGSVHPGMESTSIRCITVYHPCSCWHTKCGKVDGWNNCQHGGWVGPAPSATRVSRVDHPFRLHRHIGRSDLNALVDDGTDGGPKASCLVRPDKKPSPLHVTLTFSLPDGQHTWGIHVAWPRVRSYRVAV